MKRTLAQYGLFLREFRRTFRTTGAVLPSGKALAKALASYVRPAVGPLRILEVGPGTGAVTAQIVRSMGPADQLHLIEINERFVELLQQRFQQEPEFQQVADRTHIEHAALQSPATQPYDVVISGLPLNNFSVPEVEQLLAALVGSVRPGGTLSFFEYIAVRYAKAALSGKADRARLRGIGQALSSVFEQNGWRRQWVYPNVPPAWVHHVTVKQ